MSPTTSLPHRLNYARFPISFSNRVLQSINSSCKHMCQRRTFALSSTPLSSRYKLRRRAAAHMRAVRHCEKDVSVQRNERRTSYEWSCRTYWYFAESMPREACGPQGWGWRRCAGVLVAPTSSTRAVSRCTANREFRNLSPNRRTIILWWHM